MNTYVNLFPSVYRVSWSLFPLFLFILLLLLYNVVLNAQLML